MTRETSDTTTPRIPPASWLRRAVLGLFVVAVAVAAAGLAARWDSLMLQLSAPPPSRAGADAAQ